jgi:hypothetical protein
MTYVTQAVGIAPEADRYQMGLLRQRTAAQRYAIAAGLIMAGKRIALQQHRRRRGAQGDQYFAKSLLGGKSVSLNGPAENWVQDPIEIAKILHRAMSELQIPYFISGGVATLVHGEPRTTMDLDIVAQIDRQDLSRIVTLLESQGFYCPPGAVAEIQAGTGRMMGITHSFSALSADISIMNDTPHGRSEMARRQLIELGNGVNVWFCAPEDLILAKLEWSRSSGSEKQQRDILGVMKVQEDLLDLNYLRSWASQLDLSSRVEELLLQAGIGTEIEN